MDIKEKVTLKENRISKKRFLDPQKNKLRLNKFHQVQKGKRKGLKKRIRDAERLLIHAKENVRYSVYKRIWGRLQIKKSKI